MSHSGDWKNWEREVATDLGGKRTGPRGEDIPDIDITDVGVEAKLQKRLALKKIDIDQARDNARGLPWVLALKERKQPGSAVCRKVAVMDWYEYVRLRREALHID